RRRSSGSSSGAGTPGRRCPAFGTTRTRSRGRPRPQDTREARRCDGIATRSRSRPSPPSPDGAPCPGSGIQPEPARPDTQPESEIAQYWHEGSPQGWSRIARIAAAQRGLDRWDQARLLALVNAAIADGYIAGADTRYLYNFWRPVTAI